MLADAPCDEWHGEVAIYNSLRCCSVFDARVDAIIWHKINIDRHLPAKTGSRTSRSEPPEAEIEIYTS